MRRRGLTRRARAMLIGHFTERPYQDQEHGFFGSTTREA